MKYSICIVAYKAYDELNRCIELIRKREQDDYEILVWDNSDRLSSGSTPGEMQHFVNKVEGSNSWDKWFWNHLENGFAKGVNLLSQQAQGEYLIFINPDTEPTGDWLDRMARGLDQFDYIGCTSDYIAGIQSYLRYLDDHREFVPTKLIIPVCAMIRRDLFLEMGGFDEQFFLGCEDLDFSWRMNLAGKSMAIAADVFIHHIGHTGFELTPGKDAIIKDMESKIRAKLKAHYGDSVPSSEELWGCKILATELRPQTLSICMIYKDPKEVVLGETMRNLCDQLVVVGTGEEAMGGGDYGWPCRIDCYRFPWIDDFSAARNFALSKCTSDWVLWLDADDILPQESADLINALLKKPGNITALQCCHFGFNVQNVDKDGNIMDSFSQSRLFPRIPGVKWGGLQGNHGYVHETIFESATQACLMFTKTNIVLKHTGYSDPEVMKAKQHRNLRLLAKEPETSFTLYNFGLCYWTLGEHEKAFEYFENALKVVNSYEITFKDHIRYIMAVLIIQGGLKKDPVEYLEENTKPDAFFVLGKILLTADKAEIVAQGEGLLFKYLQLPMLNDIFGTSQAKFKPEAKQLLEKAGRL